MKKVIISLVLLASILLLNSCIEEQKSEVNDKNVIPIKKVKVETVSLTKPIISAGKLSSAAEKKLSFNIPGIVKNISVQEGEFVRKGRIIAQLDLSEIKAQYTQAKNGYDKALRDFKRAKNLYNDEVATLEQLQNSETALNVAKAQLEIANFNLNHSTIEAPENGTILMKLVEENELVNAGYPVVLFGSNSDRWKIKIGLIDKDMVKLALGDSAEIKIDAFPGKNFAGQVTEIGQAANRRSGLFEVEVQIDRNTNKFASGFVARVKLFPSIKTEYKMIPTSALINAEKMNAVVYAIDEHEAFRKINISLGDIIGNQIAVTSGLENVDFVIGEGAVYLSGSEKIQVVN